MLGGQSSDRSAFLRALDADLRRDANAVVVLRIDLDRFSRIREIFGSAVSRTVRAVLNSRVEHLVGSGAILRYGEDAFVAVVHVTDTSAEALENLGMSFVETMSAPIEMADAPRIAVGTNVGVSAGARFDEPDALRILTGAELAIQRANAIGSRRVIVYEVTHKGDPTRLPKLFADMLGAIHADQFQPAFQPVVSLPDRRVVGAEALVRWDHPEHGSIPPLEFMHEAERSGLIRDIDSRVREASIRACGTWPDHVGVSINLSPIDLDSERLSGEIEASLAASGLTAGRVVFEVTETALAQDWSRARRRLEALKDIGARLAVDDFGTGHMFLDRLSTGLFDILKIDRSVVAPDTPDAGRGTALLLAVTSMAQTLDMEVVAEGVETDEQLELVTQAGCDRAQGYLFSRPLRPADFSALVQAGGTL